MGDRAPRFSDLVEKVEVTLDRKHGKGAVFTWMPPSDRSAAVDGFVVRRGYRGAKTCHVRLSVSLRGPPKRFKVSPALAKVVKCCADVESKDRIVAAVSRYAGWEKGDFFSPFEACISVSFHSFRLIFGREISSR